MILGARAAAVGSEGGARRRAGAPRALQARPGVTVMCARRSQTSCGENHRAVLRLRCACFVGPAAWTLRRAVVAWRARGSGIALACADCGRCLGSKTPQSCAWRTRPAAHTDGCGLRLAHPSSPSPMATGRPATLLVVNTLTSRTRHRAHSWSAPRCRLADGYAAVATSRIWCCHRGDVPALSKASLLRCCGSM